MCEHDVRKFKKGKEFIAEAQRHGRRGEPVTIRNGGRHVIVSTPKGSVAIPNHAKELPTGTRWSIYDAFVRLGLVGFLVAAGWFGVTLLHALQGAAMIGMVMG